MPRPPEDLPPELGRPDRVRLAQLARDLGLPPHDLLLVGDGSGADYLRPAGWACIAYDRPLRRAVVHAGGATTGTVNAAELAPYLHALWYHRQDHRADPPAAVRVVVLSDSEVTVRCGNRAYARRANGHLWAGIDWFEANGYALHWRHVRRLANAGNVFADRLAGLARGAADRLRGSVGRLPPEEAGGEV